ncbi:hypothetical protein HK098_008284 [Nowakowskiella sp. JEL0407]|nr:hypothetical protein HK098_008284 [Nowakowskiella sp. JEL0407]
MHRRIVGILVFSVIMTWLYPLHNLIFPSNFLVYAQARQLHTRFKTIPTASLSTFSSLGDPKNISINGPFLKNLLVVRDPGSPGNIAVQNYLKTTLKALNWNVEEDKFNASTPYGVKPFNNIIATKFPQAKRKLVLAAHFDSKYFTEFQFFAASDSAAPCAILLDLAHSLNDLMEKQVKALPVGMVPEVSVQLIFFDGEEAFRDWSDTDSLYGARHLAAKWESTYITQTEPIANGVAPRAASNTVNILSTIELFVLLDLLGTKDCTMRNQFSDTAWAYDRIVDIQSRIASAKLFSSSMNAKISSTQYTNAPVIGYFLQEPGWQIQDDHIPFLARGVPILHSIAYPFPSVWHTEKDNKDALDEDVIRDLALIFRLFVVEYLGLDL